MMHHDIVHPTSTPSSHGSSPHDCPSVHVARQAAHEIANALTIVSGHAQRLALLDGANGPMSECAHAVTRATVHASAILTALRQSLNGGSRLPSRHPVPPMGLFLEAWTAIEATVRDSLVSLELDVLPARVILGDRQQLCQALINLLLNALAAVRPGDRIHLSVSSTDSWVDLAVSDTGPGMPPEVLAHCCKDGFTTKANGSGLGLAIVRSIVDAHGGTLRIDSEPGRGTTVTMRFPAAAAHAAPPVSPHVSLTTSPCLCSSKSLLVIHRDTPMRELLCEMLEAMGHRPTGVAAVTDGLSIDALALQACDLVITDQLDECLRLRQPDLPIILITTDSDLVATDSTVVLQVPFDPHELRVAIKQACATRHDECTGRASGGMRLPA